MLASDPTGPFPRPGWRPQRARARPQQDFPSRLCHPDQVAPEARRRRRAAPDPRRPTTSSSGSPTSPPREGKRSARASSRAAHERVLALLPPRACGSTTFASAPTIPTASSRAQPVPATAASPRPGCCSSGRGAWTRPPRLLDGRRHGCGHRGGARRRACRTILIGNQCSAHKRAGYARRTLARSRVWSRRSRRPPQRQQYEALSW